MGKIVTTQKFIERAISIHGNKYSYSKSKYIKAKDKIIITCDKHGDFKQAVYAHLNGQGCPKCGIEKMSASQTLTTIQFIEKAVLVHGNKYKYKNVNYINNILKVKITCPIHGEFDQQPSNHLNGSGCPKCKFEKLATMARFTQNEFIQKATMTHNGRYEYSKVNYINAITKVIIICPVHNEFEQLPYVHLLGFRCPRCNESKGEAIISQILEKNNIKFEKEFKLPYHKFRYDFYLPEQNILIEFHGRQHYEPVKIFGGEDEYKRILDRDNQKRSLAWDNKIPLLEFNDTHLQLEKETLEKLLISKINYVKI